MRKINQETYARVFKLLLDDPVTAHEVVEETGLHVVTAQSLMRTLKKHKVVHVCAWEPDTMGRDVTPVYKLGTGKDKPRRKLTAAERQARHRAKKVSLDTLLGARRSDGNTTSDGISERPDSEISDGYIAYAGAGGDAVERPLITPDRAPHTGTSLPASVWHHRRGPCA